MSDKIIRAVAKNGMVRIIAGITTDLERRMSEHFGKNERCAKYTNSHTPKKLEKVWKTTTKSLASKLEYHIKHLQKEKKEESSQRIDKREERII